MTLPAGRDCPAVSLYLTIDEASLAGQSFQTRLEQVPIAATLDAEGFRTARGRRFNGPLVWQLRQQWRLPTRPHHGGGPMPLRWDDGTYSVAGAAQIVGVTPGTVYGWIRDGRLSGRQRAKGLPWQITLADEDIDSLCQYVQRVRRIKQSKMEAA